MTDRDWSKLGGAAAFQIIERHADNWNDAERMMNEWRDAARWIPVSERLPDTWCDVLVSDGAFIGIGDCVKGRPWNAPTIGPVTHWMPLPKPPETK